MDAPAQSFTWLRPFLPKWSQPILRGLRKRWQLRKLELEHPYREVYRYTQVSQSRQRNLVRLAGIVDRELISGDIVECGVLDGGTAALMAHATSTRLVHMFDAWEGLPEATAEDGEGGKKWAGEVVGSMSRVQRAMDLLKVDPARLRFHRGWFDQTFPHANVKSVALLHIDCDFYEPTRLCLEKWLPLMAPGGFIQFDDYESYIGCAKAVDEMLQRHGARLQTWGDRGQAYFVKV